MKIVVVGGSGRIGARLVTMLARDDHEVVAASRPSGVDAVTGEGLAGALSGGPLSEGAINGSTVTCPLHGAQFNVWTGAVLCGPAKDPLKTYAVTIDGDVGRVDVPLAQAVQGARGC